MLRIFQKSLILGMAFGLLVLFAIPAMANHVDSVVVNPGCNSYTITLLASALQPGKMYTISWTIFGLGPTINDSISFTASSSTYNSGPITKSIGPLSGNFTPSGSATLEGLNTVPITFSPVSISCPVPPPCTPSSNASNFNGTPIPSGDYIWFNANFTASGIPSTGATIFFQSSTITFGTTTLSVPDARITFSPSATCATISFDAANSIWITTVPISGSDEIFLSGLSYPLTATLPGGINPVRWKGTFTSDTAGITVKWKWGAAVYKTFSTDYNLLAIKPTHSGSCSYNNSDHAGTPEGVDSTSGKPFKSFVTGGARGGGGSNFTGSWSGTVSVPVCH